MKKSKWKVASLFAGGKTWYVVYRLLDKDKPDHSGNQEYWGVQNMDTGEVDVTDFASREDAEYMAEKLNHMEKANKEAKRQLKEECRKGW